MEILPRSQQLLMPTLKALSRIGNEANIRSLEEAVALDLGLSADLLAVNHSGKRTEFQYRMAWARTKAKLMGLVESPARQIWRLTEKGTAHLTNQSEFS
jgi:restriction system protein